MVEKVEIKANYNLPNQVPHIGQRKRMRVNGRTQTMVLNKLEVTRQHVLDDETGRRHIFWYNSQEVWGGYYDSYGS